MIKVLLNVCCAPDAHHKDSPTTTPLPGGERVVLRFSAKPGEGCA